MKTIFKEIFQLIFVLILICSTSGCSKDPSNTPINTSGTFGYEFTVDGQKYSYSGNPLDFVVGEAYCGYYEDTTIGSIASLYTSYLGGGWFLGIKIYSKTALKLGTRVFDNTTGYKDDFVFIGDKYGNTDLNQWSSRQSDSSNVTLTITEKGGRFGHVKGYFSGTIINWSTLKPMTISGTFDLPNKSQ
jgi:hypothetical protein